MKRNTVAGIGLILSTIMSVLFALFGYKMFMMAFQLVNIGWLNKTLGVIFIILSAATIIVNFIHMILILMKR